MTAPRASSYAWTVVLLLFPVALLNYLDRQRLASVKFSIMQDVPDLGVEANWGWGQRSEPGSRGRWPRSSVAEGEAERAVASPAGGGIMTHVTLVRAGDFRHGCASIRNPSASAGGANLGGDFPRWRGSRKRVDVRRGKNPAEQKEVSRI